METERRRGPQRSEASRQAILGAAAQLFLEHGYDHLTVEGIATEAHVGKQTIYRWWPSKAAIIAETLAEGLLIPEVVIPPNSGDVRIDLRAWFATIFGFLRLPGNETLLRSLVVAATENDDVAVRLNERLGIWQALAGRLDEEQVDALLGGLVVRALRGGSLDEDFAERLIATVVR
jgi:AcrR family transcriptional regulator